MTYRLTQTDVIVRLSDGAFIPNDPRNKDRAEYEEWLSAGNEPDPFVPPPAKPLPLTARQLRLQLLSAGISLDAVSSAIDAMEEPARSVARVEWEYATQYERDHPLVVSLADTLGISPEMLDAAWTQALNL